MMSAPTAMIGQDLTYHGKSLLDDFGCIAEKWPDMELGAPSYTEHIAIGRDGKIYQSDHRDGDTVLKYTVLFKTINGMSYRDRYRQIRDWIYSPGEEILRESRNSGYFWKVRKATMSAIKPDSNHCASFDLEFIVCDHEYLDSGLEEIELDINDPDDELIILLSDRSGEFYLIDQGYDNRGRPADFPMLSSPAWVIVNEYAEACPLWTLSSERGWMTFVVNDTTAEVLTPYEEHITIDTEKMRTYKTYSKELANTDVNGDYAGLKLKHGSNLIYIADSGGDEEGSGVDLYLQPNWRRF